MPSLNAKEEKREFAVPRVRVLAQSSSDEITEMTPGRVFRRCLVGVGACTGLFAEGVVSLR